MEQNCILAPASNYFFLLHHSTCSSLPYSYSSSPNSYSSPFFLLLFPNALLLVFGLLSPHPPFISLLYVFNSFSYYFLSYLLFLPFVLLFLLWFFFQHLNSFLFPSISSLFALLLYQCLFHSNCPHSFVSHFFFNKLLLLSLSQSEFSPVLRMFSLIQLFLTLVSSCLTYLKLNKVTNIFIYFFFFILSCQRLSFARLISLSLSSPS